MLEEIALQRIAVLEQKVLELENHNYYTAQNQEYAAENQNYTYDAENQYYQPQNQNAALERQSQNVALERLSQSLALEPQKPPIATDDQNIELEVKQEDPAHEEDEADPKAERVWFTKSLSCLGKCILKALLAIHTAHAFIGQRYVAMKKRQMEGSTNRRNSTLKALNQYIRAATISMLLTATLYVTVPCVVVGCLLYLPFLHVYDDIQSWMVAYMTWGLCSCCYYVRLAMLLGDKTFLTSFDWLWKVVGIEMPVDMRMDKLYLCVHLASLLPAAVAGFVANFAMQEKFDLLCNDDLDIFDATVLCTTDSATCCGLVSSWKLETSYAFVGKIISNVLGVFAFVRLLAWLMTQGDPELAKYARRKK